MTKTARAKGFKPGRGYGREDWDSVSANPAWTGDDLKRARPFAELLPELAEAITRGRGRPRVAAPKEAVTLRLDPETLARFRASGKDWRTRMARILEKSKV